MTGAHLIVGLGNPGVKYRNTRHNAGFCFIEKLASRYHAELNAKLRFRSDMGSTTIAGHPVWLLRPKTRMNLSGSAVSGFLRYYQINSSQVIIVHDDIDLPAGSVRLKFSGGHGGQNGVRDIISKLGTNAFARIRLGVGRPPPGVSPTNYVLGRPTSHDRELICEATLAAIESLPLLLDGETESVMLKLHSRRVAPAGPADSMAGN